MSEPRQAEGANRALACCVVGSGPAGVACAHALLERGATVVLLDAGIDLEPDRAEIIAQMRMTSPESWRPEHVARLKAGTDVSAKGLPQKLVYGSDFPYREADQHAAADYEGVDLRPSLARGGFSNVWGAAMLPYADRDMTGWPIAAAQLTEHYGAVLKLTGLSARRDDLEGLFPIHQEQPRALELSRQAGILLHNLERHRHPLQAAGVHFGQARVAVRIAQPPHIPGCVYCGLCMYGCPYGYIYNSADTLAQLQKHPRFTYQPGTIVTGVRETSDRVRVEGYDRTSRAPIQTEAGRVYLAAGAIPTTQILLRSMASYDQPVWMKDSQYFLFPLALARSAGDVTREALQTLSQLFVEILDPAISRHTVHLQIYSYNDLIGKAVRKTFGPAARPLEWLARGLERRLLIVQGYLHSDHSARMSVTLKKADRLQIQAQLNPETRAIIGRVLRKLFRHARCFGAVPVPPMLQVAPPGRGFHSGGSFPMSAQPGSAQTDILGRPAGWKRVHAVDATVLPGIPATTITFSVMANAHRIASESAGLP